MSTTMTPFLLHPDLPFDPCDIVLCEQIQWEDCDGDTIYGNEWVVAWADDTFTSDDTYYAVVISETGSPYYTTAYEAPYGPPRQVEASNLYLCASLLMWDKNA